MKRAKRSSLRTPSFISVRLKLAKKCVPASVENCSCPVAACQKYLHVILYPNTFE